MNKRGEIKCVVVGDGAVGKTKLLMSYNGVPYDDEYTPTICDNFLAKVKVDNNLVELTLVDTAGQEEYDRLRPIQYPNTKVFILCFSIIKRTTFDNIKLKWIPELHHFSKTVPIILVACKQDMRSDPKNLCITSHEGEKLAQSIKAAYYVECSAKTGMGLKNVFEQAVRAVLMPTPTTKNSRCQLL